MSRQIKGLDDYLVFPISPKHTNLVEEVEILLLSFVECRTAVSVEKL